SLRSKVQNLGCAAVSLRLGLSVPMRFSNATSTHGPGIRLPASDGAERTRGTLVFCGAEPSLSGRKDPLRFILYVLPSRTASLDTVPSRAGLEFQRVGDSGNCFQS